jgi:CheY-like chemotaxis protein
MILLVEDEQELRSLVRCALESIGYSVREARSGPDALRVWAECRDRVELLITDLVMPEGMTGIELAERLRADKPSLKVVCTSGYSAELVELGMKLPESVRFLQKPFHSRQLAMVVREVLDEA